MSRINVKLKSDQGKRDQRNGTGDYSRRCGPAFEKLSYLKRRDVLVLSGSIPAAIDSDIYQRIMERLDGRGIRMVVDAEKDLLLKVLKYRPFLIKPNNHELGQMFGLELETEEEIILHARKLKEQGAVNVLVSMAGNGAILVAEDGSVHRRQAARGTVKKFCWGRGFHGGRIHSRIPGKGDYAYALKLGTACGGATAFSDGIGTKR